MTRVIVDTDPGTDDVLALMMALGSPDVDVVGLTTVGGNARLADTTRNTLRLLEYLGRTDVPVFRGSSSPMRGKYHYGYDFHGATGLTVRLPPSSATVKGPGRCIVHRRGCGLCARRGDVDRARAADQRRQGVPGGAADGAATQGGYRDGRRGRRAGQRDSVRRVQHLQRPAGRRNTLLCRRPGHARGSGRLRPGLRTARPGRLILGPISCRTTHG